MTLQIRSQETLSMQVIRRDDELLLKADQQIDREKPLSLEKEKLPGTTPQKNEEAHKMMNDAITENMRLKQSIEKFNHQVVRLQQEKADLQASNSSGILQKTQYFSIQSLILIVHKRFFFIVHQIITISS